MALNFGGAASGAATGALLGGGLPGGIIGGLAGLFSKKGKGAQLTDQRTEEQKQAAAILQQLAMTGSGGGINLGEAFTGSLGNFDITGLEQQGLSDLSGLFGQGQNQDLASARSTFQNLADTKFDPSDPSSGFASFSRALQKSGGQAQDRLNQQAAITGGVFGSGRGRDTASLQADIVNQEGSFLADLFQRGRSQQLAGAQGLAGIAGQEQQQTLQRIQASQQFGALQRNLKNQEAQANFSEFQRQRSEELSRIGLLTQEANRNPLLGVSSIPGSPSPFSSLISSVLGGFGQGVGENFDFGDLSEKFKGFKLPGFLGGK